MKKSVKRITAALLAAMLIGGIHMATFAAVESSEEETASSEAVEAEAASEDDAAAAAEGDATAEGDAAAAEDTTADATAPAAEAGNINESPNTGVPILPAAVALVAAVSGAVAVKTRKR